MNNIHSAYKLYILCLILLSISFGCSDDSNPTNNFYTESGKKALIIAVENNDGLLSGDFAYAFEFYKPQMLEIFSDIFGIEKSKMAGLSLNSIIETYGEPWQINDIINHTNSKYDTIIAFRNEQVTEANLKNNLYKLTIENYTIDMVFCLHGSETNISMYNFQNLNISNFTKYIYENKIRLRALYQTCCYAGLALNDWGSSGVYAINGAIGKNMITLFSPGYFIDEWVSGASFDNSVKNAFSRDIQKIKTYSNLVPIDQYLLTDKNISESKQYNAGKDISIRFSDLLK